jgi:propionyl-CoA carboxylase alpha chain
MAAASLAGALRRAHIHGSTTNRALLIRILEHPEFISGDTDTHFLLRHDIAEMGRPLLDVSEERLAALAAAVSDQALQRQSSPVLSTIPSGWRNSPSQMQYRAYTGDHGQHDIGYTLAHPFSLEGVGRVSVVDALPESVSVLIGDASHEFEVARYGELRYVDSDLGPARLVEVPRFPSLMAEDDAGSLHAPMPGRVIRVDVSAGEEVSEGQVLVVMEAMKMEHTLRSPHDGTVSAVLCEAGEQVEADTILIVVEHAD